jgi:4'-phosphopantetheinyl transferase EntD
VIATILPDDVASVEVFDDSALAVLLPEEEAAVQRAVDKRRREFATARACARRALATLGLPPMPILAGTHGEPCWPSGIVGSITHCDGYRAAAVARERTAAVLGIDAEPNSPLPRGVLAAIALPEELHMVRTLTRAHPLVCWDRLLFSAKEAVYKAWFPLGRRSLGFRAAAVNIDHNGVFHADMRVDGPLVMGRPVNWFQGRWLVADGLLITAIATAQSALDTFGARRSAHMLSATGVADASPNCAARRTPASVPERKQASSATPFR